jgi:DNA sulfur modification protein DndB
MEKSTISNRSTKLFTLSSIYQATQSLLNKKKSDSISLDEETIAKEFWIDLTNGMPDWINVKRGLTDTASLRRDFIHSHGVALHAIGVVGASIIGLPQDVRKEKIELLANMDWSRSNAKLWEGRALVGGRISKNYNNLILTVNAIKKHLEYFCQQRTKD